MEMGELAFLIHVRERPISSSDKHNYFPPLFAKNCRVETHSCCMAVGLKQCFRLGWREQLAGKESVSFRHG